MSEASDKIEDAKLFIKYSKDTIGWASINAFRRISLLLLITSILCGGWYWYITDLASKAISDIEARMSQESSLSKSNLYKFSMDSIDLCINAIDKSTDLKDWYCERALQSYKNRLSIAVSEHEKEVIDKKAYGAMKADLADKERNIKYLDLISRKMTKEAQLLDVLLSSVAVAIFIFLVLSIYCFVAYFLYKKNMQLVQKATG